MSEIREISFAEIGLEGTVRVTQDGRLSILDVISIVSGKQNARRIWSEIKSGKYTKSNDDCFDSSAVKENIVQSNVHFSNIALNDNVCDNQSNMTLKMNDSDLELLLSFCSECKLTVVPGGKMSPTIKVSGLQVLLTLIPGPKARKLSFEGIKIILRMIGGDESLIEDIRVGTAKGGRVAAANKNSINSFLKENNKSPRASAVSKHDEAYDKSYILYLRGAKNPNHYDKTITAQIDESKPRIFGLDLIKFGICFDLDKRNEKYGDDNGFFYYSFKFEQKADAQDVEAIIRKRYRNIMIDNTYEYIDTNGLYSRLNNQKTIENLNWETYQLLLRKFYCSILVEIHNMFPKLQNMPESYGLAYYTETKINILGTVTGDTSAADKIINYMILQRQNLPEYDTMLPYENYYYEQLLVREETQKLQIIEETKRMAKAEETEQARILSQQADMQEQTKQMEIENQTRQAEIENQTKQAEIAAEIRKMEIQLEMMRLERAAPTSIAVNANPPVITAVAPRARSPTTRNRNPITEVEIRELREHAKKFLQECCTLDLRACEHTVSLQTAWANYLVSHAISPQNKWQYFRNLILASRVTKASSSFTDIRNPRKPRTKGYCGIKLRGDVYAAAVELA